MSETSNKNGLFQKMKDTKVSRATIVTSVMLVAALAIIISVTVISNRSKKNEEIPDQSKDPSISDPVENTTPEPEKEVEAPNDSNTQTPPVNTGSSVVGNKLPSFILPVSGSLAKGHDPKLQVYSNTMNDYRTHLGVDLTTAENAPVYAAADGTVSKIWKDDWMGYCIAVKHSGNCYTIYQNLSETLPDGIKEGSAVRSGQLIASVGDSAALEIAEEPHLHFEMTINDLSVNPLEYFSEESLKSLSMDASYGE